jgi:SAM-dependent methyltransferase
MCRFCRAPLGTVFADLGMSPLCQSQVEPDDLDKSEVFYPLKVFLCDNCLLAQLPAFAQPGQIFSEYAYFSSYVDMLLKQAEAYADMATTRFGLGPRSKVVEVASNDGYLLQYFVKKGIPVLGVEPAANVARTAVEKGVPTVVRFFGQDTARMLAAEGGMADLLLGNNVLPHVPDLHDFVGGLKILLKPGGVLTLDFQHLLRMMEGMQFDTIYQEHYSYLTLAFVDRLLKHHALELFDAERLPTHGGSLRAFVRHAGESRSGRSPRLEEFLAEEERAGMGRPETYAAFGEKIREVKRGLLEFLIAAKREGKSIAGYGAAGKTNTLLNFCGIRSDFIDYTVDRNPYKQGRFLPGSRIPIYPPDRIRETRPDYLFIGPWNLSEEIMGQTAYIREWGGKWIIPIPCVKVVD